MNTLVEMQAVELAAKDDIRRLADQALARQSLRIGVVEARDIAVIRMEFEILDRLRRIYTIAKSIAKEFVLDGVVEKA